jgi:hypothetical protein
MTRTEAEAHCSELNRDPERQPGDRWIAQETSPGEWRAVRLHVDGFKHRDPLKTTAESRPKPPDAPDPRASIFQNVPPYGAG